VVRNVLSGHGERQSCGVLSYENLCNISQKHRKNNGSRKEQNLPPGHSMIQLPNNFPLNIS
jgi:hypothetical protein